MTPLKFPTVADAYLEWGLHDGFKGFGDAFPDKPGLQVGLLVEWAEPPPRANQLPAEVDVADFYLSEKFAAFTVEALWLNTNDGKAFFAQFVNRCELAAPVATLAPAAPVVPALPEVPYTGADLQEARSSPQDGQKGTWQPQSEVLLACIDDAFPIASKRFFKNGSSRVLRIWDQQHIPALNQKFSWRALGNAATGLPNVNFRYGAELIHWKGFSSANTTKKAPTLSVELNDNETECLQVFDSNRSQLNPSAQFLELPTTVEAAHDQSYYERARMSRMRRRLTHGAHVLDVMAGPIAARARISPSRDLRGGGDGSSTAAPAWLPADDAASKADLVLVQLPDYAINDPSGRWLARNVLDGLHYIVKSAGATPLEGGNVKKLVVNLSWGPQTGPHDGTSLLESAIDDLVVKQKEAGREVAVILPTGNSFSSRAHAQFAASSGCESLVWCVPPGALTAAFLEVWWPEASNAAGASYCLTVTSPSGQSLSLTELGTVAVPGNAWGITSVNHGSRRMTLVTLAPTFSHDAIAKTATHGKWLVAVKALANAMGDVHIYVARADHNMGAKRTSAPSYLFDPIYEDMRRSKTGKFAADRAGSIVRRDGTLNGLATGQNTYVAGGYRLADRCVSWYSSSGPSATRIGPDYVYPCDESIALVGIKAGAVRDGAVTRLIGTSAAAPQMARDIAGMPAGVPFMPTLATLPLLKREGLGRR